jgi:hypothetical protein
MANVVKATVAIQKRVEYTGEALAQWNHFAKTQKEHKGEGAQQQQQELQEPTGYWFYELTLLEAKRYVGRTTQPPAQRMEQHLRRRGKGSAWTDRYRPIKMRVIAFSDDAFDEDKWVLKTMAKHGIPNVRGGSFCQIELKEEIVRIITIMIASAKDECYKCGKRNHFARSCEAKTTVTPKPPTKPPTLPTTTTTTPPRTPTPTTPPQKAEVKEKPDDIASDLSALKIACASEIASS